MIDADQIDIWLTAQSETNRLEFKEAKKNFEDEKVFRYCVAIANEGGGHLVLGVTDAIPRRVCGTLAYQNVISITEKIFDKLGFRVDVVEIAHPNGRVLVFEIPSRPRGSAYRFEGAYLMRSGSKLVSMSEDRLRRIFEEGRPDWLEEFTRKDVTSDEVVKLLDTQAFFDLVNLPYPTNREGVVNKLVQERLIDATNSGFSIRRIGALLLAKNLKEFSDISRKAARVIVYKGNSKFETRIDQTGAKGYAVGFQGLVSFIMEQLPRNEIIEDALRTEAKLVPDIVIREIVANALIHQDFRVDGASVMVEIFENRIEVSNPGTPIVPLARFIDGYQSRNERLADLMRRMGICEEKGSGIDRVVNETEIFQLPAPDFRESFNRTSVIVYGSRSFEKMDRNDRVRACYQHCALKRVMSEHMTNQSLRTRLKLPESKSVIVSQIINAALEEGLIKPDDKAGNSRKFARYLPFWA